MCLFKVILNVMIVLFVLLLKPKYIRNFIKIYLQTVQILFEKYTDTAENWIVPL